MKKAIFVIFAAMMFVACNDSSPRGENGTDSTEVGVDSANLLPPSLESDSAKVADSSVAVLDSTVAKIGKE